MASAPLPLEASPIAFGTDGWRGILGVDITVERLLPVAAAAARELESSAPAGLSSREIVIGYDRRFMAPELAEAICSAVRGADLVPVLADSPIPTPAASWAVVERAALGALRKQARKTAALLVQQQLTVRRPLPLRGVAVAIKPGPPLAAQPAAQQPVVERGFIDHGPHRRRPGG